MHILCLAHVTVINGLLQGDNFQINVIDNLSNETMLKSTTIVSWK